MTTMNNPTNNTPGGATASAAGREKVDSWTGQIWKIAVVSKGLDELYVNGSPPQFRLERRPGGPTAVYALTPVTPIELPGCLASNVLLTQHGTMKPRVLKGSGLLAAPFVQPHAPYWNASEEVLRDNRDLIR